MILVSNNFVLYSLFSLENFAWKSNCPERNYTQGNCCPYHWTRQRKQKLQYEGFKSVSFLNIIFIINIEKHFFTQKIKAFTGFLLSFYEKSQRTRRRIKTHRNQAIVKEEYTTIKTTRHDHMHIQRSILWPARLDSSLSPGV